MTNPNFKFCGETISKPKEHEELSIDAFNEDVVEVVRKYTKTHPDVRIKGTSESYKYIVKNFGYKNVASAIEYFNNMLKQ